jgi:hypothetical protein
MFGVEEHGRDDDQADGSQQGWQSQGPIKYWEGCAHINTFVGHADKLSGVVCA